MSEYAIIALDYADQIPLDGVPIYTPSFVPSMPPCMKDSNGDPIPNALLMEAKEFSVLEREAIEDYDGYFFEDAAAYHVFMQQRYEELESQAEETDAFAPEDGASFDHVIDDVGTAPDPEIDEPIDEVTTKPLDAEQPPADSPESDPHETD